MSDCKLRPTGKVDGAYHEHLCPDCGQNFWSKWAEPERCHQQCATEAVHQSQPPGFFAKAWSLAEATVRWTAAGCPTRSETEIESIFAICQSCPHFKPGKTDDRGSCGKCGCCVANSGTLVNKIKMATEACPLDPPKWSATAT